MVSVDERFSGKRRKTGLSLGNLPIMTTGWVGLDGVQAGLDSGKDYE